MNEEFSSQLVLSQAPQLCKRMIGAAVEPEALEDHKNQVNCVHLKQKILLIFGSAFVETVMMS